MLDIQVTYHANQRIKERGIKKKEALKLLRTATLAYRKENGTVVYKNGNLRFAVVEYEHFWRLLTVITDGEKIDIERCN